MSTAPEPLSAEDAEQLAFAVFSDGDPGPLPPPENARPGEVPPAVPVELLYRLNGILNPNDPVALVLRGSLLLRHWYGDRARPPADLDLEVFLLRPDRGRRFTSPVDHARALCCFSIEAGSSQAGVLAFGGGWDEMDDVAPDGRQNLWAYGTAGQRFYVGYESSAATVGSGRLQIDIADAGPYAMADLSVADEPFKSLSGETFTAPAYSREAMLAAKVSWLVRGFRRSAAGIAWAGEPKDLFDAHLLASDPALRPDVFRRAMLAVGEGDDLHWPDLHALFHVRTATVADDLFGNWPAFAARLSRPAAGPAALWAELAGRLGPLLGDLYPPAEVPFLAAVAARPADELAYLVYADWLDERDDPRGPLLRRVADRLFRTGGGPGLSAALDAAPPAWLVHLFGSTARYRKFRDEVAAG